MLVKNWIIVLNTEKIYLKEKKKQKYSMSWKQRLKNAYKSMEATSKVGSGHGRKSCLKKIFTILR